MHRLIHISRSLVGSSADKIELNVERSVVHNQANGVTRMLCVTAPVFAQVLEGEHEPLVEAMSRVRADLGMSKTN
jgi:hypothetical protein